MMHSELETAVLAIDEMRMTLESEINIAWEDISGPDRVSYTKIFRALLDSGGIKDLRERAEVADRLTSTRLGDVLREHDLSCPQGNIYEAAVEAIETLVADLETARASTVRYMEYGEHLKSELERMLGSFVIVLRSDLKRLIDSEVPNEKG